MRPRKTKGKIGSNADCPTVYYSGTICAHEYTAVLQSKYRTVVSQTLLFGLPLSDNAVIEHQETDWSEQVVQASSPGLQSSTVEIPVSGDLERDGVLGVASRSVNLALVDAQ